MARVLDVQSALAASGQTATEALHVPALDAGFRLLYELNPDGPNFTWPLMMFAGVAPERILRGIGKIHVGKPLVTKSRRELIASLRPNYLQHLRTDNGDLPKRPSRSAEDPSGQSQMNFVPSPRSLRVLP